MSIIKNNSVITDREIYAERILNASRELVWKVWTKPEHIAKWWGPDGFTNTIETMNVKKGGQWKFIMHGPDSIDYRNLITYIEVKEPELLIYEHGPSPKFVVTVIINEMNGKTKLSVRMAFDTAELLNNTVETFNAIEGLNQTLGKLEKYILAFDS